MNHLHARLETVTQSRPERRWDLDWLRVLAFALLVFFHAAVLFLPQGIPNVLNETPSRPLGAFVVFSHQFRLSLLFLVSGMGVRFALRHRSAGAYLRDRCRRLLIPLAFGIAVLVPPMVYLEKRYNGVFEDSFGQFYLRLFADGLYPSGNLSWHHYWFIAYLFLFCLVSWPLFRYWRQPTNQWQLGVLGRWLEQGGRLYWVTVPLIAVELILRPAFPGFRNLITDWASFSHWLIVFVCGYVLANRPALVERCRELRYLSLTVGIIGSAIVFWQYYDYDRSTFVLQREVTFASAMNFIWFSVLRTLAIWGWLMTCMGFAARYLNRPSRVLSYLNAAVYPLFCLHLPLIVMLGVVVLPLDLSISAKYLLIVTGCFGLAHLVYEGLVRRVRYLGVVFGVQQPTSTRSAPPTVSRKYHRV